MRFSKHFSEANHVAIIVLALRAALPFGNLTWSERQANRADRYEETAMRQLLVHAKSFARIEEALKPYSDQISPLVLDDEGDLKHPWGKSEATGAIAYGTADAYFAPSVMVFFQTLFGLTQLDWFQSSAAGTEHPMIQATGKKAELFTGSHAQSHAIAEWVLWAGLDFYQGGAARRQAQKEEAWGRLPFREISNTRWLIVGFGAIGKAAGARLKALGADVTGGRRSGGGCPGSGRNITPEDPKGAPPGGSGLLFQVPFN